MSDKLTDSLKAAKETGQGLGAAKATSTKSAKSAGTAQSTGTSLTPPKRTGIGNVAAAMKPAAHKRGEPPQPIIDAFSQDHGDTKGYAVAVKFAFIGAGQGGGRLADSFWQIGYRRVAAFNTTATDFEGLALEMPKLSLDIGGAGKDMQLAKQNAIGRREEIWSLFSRAWGTDLDWVILCASLGGGTGSGSAIPIIEAARQYMESLNRPVRVGAVVSLPSLDDGPKTTSNAVQALKDLLDTKISPLIVIDNDRVDAIYRPPMDELLPKSNQLVSKLLHLFNQLAATRTRHMTFDQSEFVQLLDSGICVFGAADIDMEQVQQPNEVAECIRTELANSVLASVDLTTGRKAACIFVGEASILSSYTKDYFAAGYTMLNRIIGKNCTEEAPAIVHRGLYEGDPEQQRGLQCYTMVAELDPPYDKIRALVKASGAGGNTANSLLSHFGLE